MASQYEEDSIIQWLLPERAGRYLDVGCSHPINLSNTYQLYKRGWRGVCVDVRAKELAPLWGEHRPADNLRQAAIGVPGKQIMIYMPQDGDLASSREDWSGEPCQSVAFTGVSLHGIWQQAGESQHPDFVSLDVEGGEADAINHCDWQAFRPRVLCVESQQYRTLKDTFGAWEPTLFKAGYTFIRTTKNRLNRFYRRKP